MREDIHIKIMAIWATYGKKGAVNDEGFKAVFEYIDQLEARIKELTEWQTAMIQKDIEREIRIKELEIIIGGRSVEQLLPGGYPLGEWIPVIEEEEK